MKNEKETQDLLDKADNSTRNFSGMTYLDGVKAALEWVLEQTEDGEGPLD